MFEATNDYMMIKFKIHLVEDYCDGNIINELNTYAADEYHLIDDVNKNINLIEDYVWRYISNPFNLLNKSYFHKEAFSYLRSNGVRIYTIINSPSTNNFLDVLQNIYSIKQCQLINNRLKHQTIFVDNTDTIYSINHQLKNTLLRFRPTKKCNLIISKYYNFQTTFHVGTKYDGIWIQLNDINLELMNKLNVGGYLVIKIKENISDEKLREISEISKKFYQLYIVRSKTSNICDYNFNLVLCNYDSSLEERCFLVPMLNKFNNYYVTQKKKLQKNKNNFLKLSNEKQLVTVKNIFKKNTTISLQKTEILNIKTNLSNNKKSNSLIENIFCPEKYFNLKECFDLNSLCLTKEAIYSMSKPFVASNIAEIIIQQLKKRNMEPKTCIITDSTGNIGGDTLCLSKYFKQVNAVEINHDNYTALCQNVNAFQRKNIVTINDSYENVYDKLEQDIVYTDPPWGGLYYNKIDQQMLYLGKMSMADIFIRCAAKMFVYKLPINFNFSEFILTLNRISEYKIHLEVITLCSFVIMVVWKLEKKINNTHLLDNSI